MNDGDYQILSFLLAKHTRLKKKADKAYDLAHLLIYIYFLSFQAPSDKKVAS